MLARHIMNVLQDPDRFRSDVQSLSGTWHGTVSIACIESLTESVLPDLIAVTSRPRPARQFHHRGEGIVGRAGGPEPR